MKIDRKFLYAMFAVVLLAGFVGYYFNSKSSQNPKENFAGPEESEYSQSINMISIGTVGDDAVKLIKMFQPTADYIASKLNNNGTKYKGRVIIVKTVDNMTDLMKQQKVDLYIDSLFPTVLVSKGSGAVPFLRRWKDGVSEYHSVFFVERNSSIKTINDFKGKIIVFEDPGSTSGYFLPKAYLIKKGFNLSRTGEKNNITYVFSGNAENIALWVIEGKNNIGAFSNLDFESLSDPIKEKLKIVEQTDNVPRHMVSYRSGLDTHLVERIKGILMDMDKDPQGVMILNDFQKTRKYDEISKEEILNASNSIGLLDQ